MAANNDQDTAKKAAEEATAKKEAEEAKKRRTFKAKHQILLGGELVPPGETVTLTREQFETLSGLGAIEGDWK
jgi:hypothetical protein